MSDIHHYHAGQFFAFKTQIGLKLFLFQLDNLLLLPFKLCLMDYTLALTIGILLGVYSSVFVSAAIALYLGVKREDLVKKVRKDEISDMVP